MTPQERQKETFSKLWETMPGGVRKPEEVRGLAAALWETVHNEGLDRDQILEALALLSGVATVALLDYAELLENQHAPA